MMICGETACSAFSPYSVGSHACRVFPELSEPCASGIFQSSLSVSLLKLPKRLMINSWFRTEVSLSIEVLTWTLPDCPEAVKVEKEKNSYLLCGKNRAGREEICHALMDDFCEPRKPVLSKLFKIRFVSAYSCWRLPRVVGALFTLFEQQPETWKNSGKTGKFLPDEKKIAKPLFCHYSAPAFLSSTISNGQVSEWSNEHAWKVCVPQTGTEGSNPSLSAINFPPQYIRNGYIAVFVCRSMGKILGKRVILLLLSPSEILQEVLTMRNPKA